MILFIVATLFSCVLADGTSSGRLYHYYAGHDHSGQCLNATEFDKIFLDMDTQTRDARVSLQEFISGWKHDHLKDKDDVTFFFYELDYDRDTYITKKEMDHYFSFFDENNDNCLTYSEFTTNWDALFNL